MSNYHAELELWPADDEHQLDPDCELAAAYGRIQVLKGRIKDLESRPRLDVGTVHLHKLTSQISKLEGELQATKQNIDLLNSHLIKRAEDISRLNDEVSHWFNEFQAEKTAAHKKVGELEEALQWYAEKGNMDRYIGTSEHHSNGEHWFNCWMMSPVTDKARRALGMKTETEELLNGRSNNSR